jgi:hypothetical protein
MHCHLLLTATHNDLKRSPALNPNRATTRKFRHPGPARFTNYPKTDIIGLVNLDSVNSHARKRVGARPTPLYAAPTLHSVRRNRAPMRLHDAPGEIAIRKTTRRDGTTRPPATRPRGAAARPRGATACVNAAASAARPTSQASHDGLKIASGPDADPRLTRASTCTPSGARSRPHGASTQMATR